jgi:hypothetical protein
MTKMLQLQQHLHEIPHSYQRMQPFTQLSSLQARQTLAS